MTRELNTKWKRSAVAMERNLIKFYQSATTASPDGSFVLSFAKAYAKSSEQSKARTKKRKETA